MRSLALAGAIALTSPASLMSVKAETDSLQSIPWEWENHNSPDFSGDGRPKRTAGGASRNECQKSDLPLTALIPDTSVALTAAESPTFWFYLPYTLTPQHSVEFVLKDSDDNYIHQTKFNKATSPGVISLRLPPNVTIDAEQNYHWYFLVYCQPQNPAKFVYVSGSLRRVENSYLNSSLKSPSSEELLHFYVTEGLWHDAVTHLAEQMKANPQNTAIQNDWETLLQSVGLEELANKPFGDRYLSNIKQ